MLKKDSYWLGFLIGILMPSILFSILYALNYYTKIFEHPPVVLPVKKMLFVSVALNILPIRYYFKNVSLGKTGQGILFITVFLIFMIILAV